MDSRLRHKETGSTVEENAKAVASELEIDAVGLWQVVPDVRDGFGLEGDALDEVLRYHLLGDAGRGPTWCRSLDSQGRLWRHS
jgi:hypothetical protein